jgi:hypothetical protein
MFLIANNKVIPLFNIDNEAKFKRSHPELDIELSDIGEDRYGVPNDNYPPWRDYILNNINKVHEFVECILCGDLSNYKFTNFIKCKLRNGSKEEKEFVDRTLSIFSDELLGDTTFNDPQIINYLLTKGVEITNENLADISSREKKNIMKLIVARDKNVRSRIVEDVEGLKLLLTPSMYDIAYKKKGIKRCEGYYISQKVLKNL